MPHKAVWPATDDGLARCDGHDREGLAEGADGGRPDGRAEHDTGRASELPGPPPAGEIEARREQQEREGRDLREDERGSDRRERSVVRRAPMAADEREQQAARFRP